MITASIDKYAALSAKVAAMSFEQREARVLEIPLSRPRTNFSIVISNTSHIRRSVVTVIGLPASTCCQWRVENPNDIMSS